MGERTYLGTATIGNDVCSLSPRVRAGRGVCFRRQDVLWVAPLPCPLPTPSSRGEGSINPSKISRSVSAGSSARPESHQQPLRRLNQNFAQQLFHAGRFRLIQSADQPQGREIDDRGGGKKNREPIPAHPEPMRLPCPDRIDQQAPGNGRQ